MPFHWASQWAHPPPPTHPPPSHVLNLQPPCKAKYGGRRGFSLAPLVAVVTLCRPPAKLPAPACPQGLGPPMGRCLFRGLGGFHPRPGKLEHHRGPTPDPSTSPPTPTPSMPAPPPPPTLCPPVLQLRSVAWRSSSLLRALSTDSSALAASAAKKSDAIAAVASVAPAAAAPAARPVVSKASSLTDRVLSFMAGLGVGGVIGYYKLTEDIWESTAEVRGPPLQRSAPQPSPAPPPHTHRPSPSLTTSQLPARAILL
jgi:hypothetical protein